MQKYLSHCLFIIIQVTNYSSYGRKVWVDLAVYSLHLLAYYWSTYIAAIIFNQLNKMAIQACLSRMLACLSDSDMMMVSYDHRKPMC